jgi:hypothetical protein
MPLWISRCHAKGSIFKHTLTNQKFLQIFAPQADRSFQNCLLKTLPALLGPILKALIDRICPYKDSDDVCS